MDSFIERPTYNDTEVYWKHYQAFFSDELQIKENNLPTEEWWNWNDCQIHLDRLPCPESKTKVIMIHGAGGNGRLLAPYARMLQLHGYEVVSPDLPPYGLSSAKQITSIDYQHWIQIITDLIEREIEQDGKPIVLLGASIGGMLAYHAASRNKKVKGLIVTTFVDTSKSKVRDQIAPNKVMSRSGKFIMDTFPYLLDSFRISVSRVSRMKLITNNSQLTQFIINDPLAAGTKISFRFLRTFLNMKPLVEPENFDSCPILLVHPELDPMTPFELSEPFYNRLKCKKAYVILEGAGHFPIEEPGIEQMREAVLSFIKEIEIDM
ncbi:alpha/beta hydrolase [Ureibacillus aquaedulcis]|uniref:Alpha/beta hydrolase n=1 Tax=Ureibacillus aquaedulcis TaxID=3058421 RepID=A0ABT8GNV8_9BACL|nr:alpha/beta hydrolase [Ureibacillus sp. BA0131]MDN4492611.1 alpha/beta hydrolase [Ureibacillus sp. BA0131]